jgi:tetratricopeptide (TPR) repeat protein
MLLEAIRLYVTRLLEAQPNDPDAWSVLALTQLALRNDDAALQAAERVLALPATASKSSQVQARTVRAGVYSNRQEAQKALAEFEEVWAGAPQSYRAAFGRASAYAALGEMEKALTAVDHALQLAMADWQRVEARLGRARILARLGRTDEARQALDDARALDPRSADALAAQLFPTTGPMR